MIRLGKRVRAGFTLVEMLVVIVIISILAALITAAAASALWSAKQTKIKVEVDMLAGAMEAFKQKYNSYPPANLSCMPDMSGNYSANPQLTAFVARAFPRYSIQLPPAHDAGIANRLRLARRSTSAACSCRTPRHSIRRCALVFWLSGLRADPTDPFNRNWRHPSSSRRSPFFSFDQTRL